MTRWQRDFPPFSLSVLILLLMGLKVHVVLIFLRFSGFCFLHFNLVYLFIKRPKLFHIYKHIQFGLISFDLSSITRTTNPWYQIITITSIYCPYFVISIRYNMDGILPIWRANQSINQSIVISTYQETLCLITHLPKK